MAKTRRIALALRIDLPQPVNQETYAGVQRYARERRNWKCEIAEWPLAEGLDQSLQFDGIISRNTGLTSSEDLRINIPYVNTRFGHDQPGVSGVYIDAQRAGELIADHLIDRGFQRLAYLVDRDYRQADAICHAFAEACEQRGHTCTRQNFNTSARNRRDFWQAARSRLEPLFDMLEPPVGMLIAFPWMTRLAITFAEDRGWHVPQEVALVSLDNIPTVLDHPPQITSIDLNYEQVGYEAAAMLDRMMDGEQAEPQQIYVPPKGLIKRASTDYFAVEDEVVAAALRYISANLRHNLTVERLADHVAVSPRSLQLRFEAALNRPVSGEVRRLRLEAAKRLLRDESLQISQIARQVGFNSPVTINNIFHRELGMSPREYRKQLTAERPGSAETKAR